MLTVKNDTYLPSTPTLYNIVRKKSASVRTVLSKTPLNMAFKRSLVGGNLQAWHEVVAMVADAQ
jgi:hypothetical protein